MSAPLLVTLLPLSYNVHFFLIQLFHLFAQSAEIFLVQVSCSATHRYRLISRMSDSKLGHLNNITFGDGLWAMLDEIVLVVVFKIVTLDSLF